MAGDFVHLYSFDFVVGWGLEDGWIGFPHLQKGEVLGGFEVCVVGSLGLDQALDLEVCAEGSGAEGDPPGLIDLVTMLAIGTAALGLKALDGFGAEVLKFFLRKKGRAGGSGHADEREIAC